MTSRNSQKKGGDWLEEKKELLAQRSDNPKLPKQRLSSLPKEDKLKNWALTLMQLSEATEQQEKLIRWRGRNDIRPEGSMKLNKLNIGRQTFPDQCTLQGGKGMTYANNTIAERRGISHRNGCTNSNMVKMRQAIFRHNYI